MVDAVNTVPPGDAAQVNLTLVGSVLHFTFDLPQGAAGSEGPSGSDGPPGNDGEQGPQGTDGSDGAPGPPFAAAVVDSVNTLDPWENATVDASFDGSNVHFTFGLPRGYNGTDGADGGDGAPGEVSQQALDDAINGTSANTNGVTTLGIGADADYNQIQIQELINKVDELINALRR